MVYYIDTVNGTFCFDKIPEEIYQKIKYEIREEKSTCLSQFRKNNYFNTLNPKHGNNFKIGLDNFETYIFSKSYNSVFYHESYTSPRKLYYGLCKKSNQIILDDIRYTGEEIIFNDINNVPKYLYLRLLMLNECDESKIDYNNIFHVFSIVIIFTNNKVNKIIFLDTHTIKNYIDQSQFFAAIYKIFPQKEIFPDEINIDNNRRWERNLKTYLCFPYDDVLEELWVHQKKSLEPQLQKLNQSIFNHDNQNNWDEEQKEHTYIIEKEKYLEGEKYRYKNFYKNLQSNEHIFLGNGEGYCNAWSLYFVYHAILFIKINQNTNNLCKLYKYIFKKLLGYNKLTLFLIINKFWIDTIYLHNNINKNNNDNIMTNLHFYLLNNREGDINLFLESCYFDIDLSEYNKIILDDSINYN